MNISTRLRFLQVLIALLVTLTPGHLLAETIFGSLFSSSQQRPLITLQDRLENSVHKLNLTQAVHSDKLGIALVDISDSSRVEFAGLNHYTMQYAASLPKLAILFGLMKRIDDGHIRYSPELQRLASDMMQYSSNTAATDLYYRVGPNYLASLLRARPYSLYDLRYGGGLWVGKEYGKSPAWQREPLMDLSHAANPVQVARLYYMMDQDELFDSSWVQREMKKLMRGSELDHKFIRGLNRCCPNAVVYRKSGSWSTFHSDSVLVENEGKKYIAVALTNDPEGSSWLEDLIVEFDRIVPCRD